MAPISHATTDVARGFPPIGKRVWAIAEGYIPAWSHGDAPEMVSHEAVCLLNVNDTEAHVRITIFHNDCEPVE